MSSLRILHLCAYPLYSGPMPHVVGLALAQRAAGDQAWIAYDTKRGNFNGFEEDAKPHIEAAKLAAPMAMTLSSKSTPMELWRDAQALKTFVRQRRIQVVHVHLSHDHTVMALALRKAEELGVIRARTVHSARSLEQRVGQKLLLSRADTWIVRSQSHARELLNGFRLDASRLHVIPGSVDASVFVPRDGAARAAVRARFDIPDDALLIAQTALIAPGRGQEALVRAVAYMGDSPVHALFVGRGENEHAIRELARELGVSHRIHFAGYVGLPGLVDMYAAADVAFVARPGNDAASRGALEAMACGKPVLALREAALAETVTDRVGYPISAVSPDLVARAMRVILDDRADAELRGQTARELVATARTFEREAKLTRDAYTVAGAAVQPHMPPSDV